jgi:hypothetical protein
MAKLATAVADAFTYGLCRPSQRRTLYTASNFTDKVRKSVFIFSFLKPKIKAMVILVMERHYNLKICSVGF